MVIIITYDLRTPKDYHVFFEAIKAQGEAGKWWHYMSSTWLLSTTKTPQQIVEAISPHLDQQDSLFVCELKPNYQGRLPKAAWDWINSELVQLPSLNFYGSLFGPASSGVVPGSPEPPNPFFDPGKTGKLSDMLDPKGPLFGEPILPPIKPIKKPGER